MQDKIIRVEKWSHPTQPTEEELRQKMLAEGLQPHRWSNNPGDYYDIHQHPYHKVIYVVSGSIVFGFPIEEDPTTLRVGDRLELPAGVRHNAAVGPQGVVCLEAHRQP
jgi:quercetin dioxygenase-like cupin family protein